jgi:hypothetical protein
MRGHQVKVRAKVPRGIVIKSQWFKYASDVLGSGGNGRRSLDKLSASNDG